MTGQTGQFLTRQTGQLVNQAQADRTDGTDVTIFFNQADGTLAAKCATRFIVYRQTLMQNVDNYVLRV